MKDYNDKEITTEMLLALEVQLHSLADALWKELCDGKREGNLQKILNNYEDHEKVEEASLVCYRLRKDMAEGE